MTDDEIKNQILEYFSIKFENFGGDELFEGVAAYAPEGQEDAAYDRACQLLGSAKLAIQWGD